MKIERIWSELEVFLKDNAKGVLDTLNPPVSDKELEIFEQKIGGKLPKDFKSYLKVHNGQTETSHRNVLCEEGQLYSIESMMKWYEATNNFNLSEKGGLINGWSALLVPFADGNGGDYLCIDISTGKIIKYWGDDLECEEVFESFSVWFQSKLTVFQQKEFGVDEGFLDFWEYL